MSNQAELTSSHQFQLPLQALSQKGDVDGVDRAGSCTDAAVRDCPKGEARTRLELDHLDEMI